MTPVLRSISIRITSRIGSLCGRFLVVLSALLLLAACGTGIKPTQQPKQKNQTQQIKTLAQQLRETGEALHQAQQKKSPSATVLLPLLERMKQLLEQLQAPKRALYYARTIRDLQTKQGPKNRLKLAQATAEVARLLDLTGAHAEAIETYLKTLDLYGDAPQHARDKLVIEIRIAKQLKGLGRFSDVERLLRSSLAKLGNPKLQDLFETHKVSSKGVIEDLITIRRARGDITGVAALLALAQQDKRLTAQERVQAATRLRRLDFEFGNYRLARRNLQSLLDTRPRNGSQDTTASIMDEVTETLIVDSQYDAAADYIDRAVRLRQRDRTLTAADQMDRLLLAARQARDIRRQNDAKLYISRAVLIGQNDPSLPFDLKNKLDLAQVENLLSEGHIGKARTLALGVDKRIKGHLGANSIRRIPALRLAAEAAIKLRKLSLADDLIFEACEIARRNLGPWAPQTIALYAEMAAVKDRRFQYKDRYVAINAAAHGYRVLFRDALMASNSNRRAVLKTSREIFIRHVAAGLELLRKDKLLKDKDRYEIEDAIFQSQQMARAAGQAVEFKSLTHQLSQDVSRTGFLVRKRQDLSLRRALVLARLQERRWRQYRHKEPDLLTLSKQLWQQQLELDGQIAGQTRLSRLLNFAPLSLADVQKRLKNGETVLVYLTGRDQSFVTAITAERHMLRSIIASAPQLGRRIKRLRRRLDPIRDANQRRRFQYDVSGAFALYRLLLAPLQQERMLKGRLMIVPDGPLTSLPFASLISKLPLANEKINVNYYVGAAWLVRDHSLIFLSNTQDLRMRSLRKAKSRLKRRGTGTKKISRVPIIRPLFKPVRFQAFANPGFRGEDRGLRGIDRRELFSLASVMRAGKVSGKNLRLLPVQEETSIEAHNFAQKVGAQKTTVFENGWASETHFRNISERPIHTLLLPVHGLIAGENNHFGEAALVLAPPKDEEQDKIVRQHNDGLFTISDIIASTYPISWLALTGLNSTDDEYEAKARGLIPLLSAWQYAGAKSILAAHWSLAPNPMVTLVSETIRNTDNGVPADKSLQKAMMSMILNAENPELRHPMMWAPVYFMPGQKLPK